MGSNVRISSDAPTTRIGEVKSYVKTTARTVAIESWEYNQDGIKYNEPNLTYDGVFGYDILTPRVRIASF